MSRASPQRKSRPVRAKRLSLNSPKLYDDSTSIAARGTRQGRVHSEFELKRIVLKRQCSILAEAIYLPLQYGARALRVTRNVVDPLSRALVGVRQGALFPRPSRVLDLNVSAGTDGGIGSDHARALRQFVGDHELLDRHERWLVFANPWFSREGDRDFARWRESGLTKATLAIQCAIIRRNLNDDQLDFLVERLDALCVIGERLIGLCCESDGKAPSKAGAVNG